MTKRVLAFLLAILMILPMLAGCATEQTGSNNQTNDQTNDQPNDEAPSPPVDETPSSIIHTITAETISQYSIVYAEGADESAQKFCDTLNNYFGTTITPQKDTQPAADKEIVIGAANRDEIIPILEERHTTDGVVACVGNRILITSSDNNSLEKAITLFWKKFYNKDSKTIEIRDKALEVDSEFSLPKNLKINGVDLAEYKIVYPAKADPVTRYVAFALSDYFKANANILLMPRKDSNKATEHEILIGATNRPESDKAKTLKFSDSQYTLYIDGNKVVCHGNGFHVGSAVHEFITTYFPDTGTINPINATTIPTEPTVKSFVFPEATSAIMMIGDGMGNNHINMALAAGALDHFYARDLPYQTWCKTYSLSGTTDSAASATALATGFKTHNGYIGKNSSGGNIVNVSEVAAVKGANVAVLTTDYLDGATPAGFNTHTISRNNSADILAQFDKKLENGQLKYALGRSGGALTQDTRNALSLISKNNSRFFIMIEEAYTDKGSHSNDAGTSNEAVARFNDAIAYAIAFVMLHPDTALLITADHETGGIIRNPNGSYSYTTGSHTNTNVPYFALGGANVKEFVETADVLENVWNAMFIASIFGVEKFGDPNLRYK